jgi:hypothetical protein
MAGLSRRCLSLGLPAASLVASTHLAGGHRLAQAGAARVGPVGPLAQVSIGRFRVTALVDGRADIGVRIEDDGQSLLMVSDMLFPAIHPGDPAVGFFFEQDPDAAQRMRARFFPRAAAERALIAATHMPFPGLGRITSDGGRLRWVAAEGTHSG